MATTGALASEAEIATVQSAAEDVLRQAQRALESGEIGTAAKLFEDFRRASPDHPAGWLGGGLAADAAGDLAQAAEYLGRAAALDPERAEIHLSHGRVLVRLGASAPALAAFARARRLDPTGSDGYLLAALLQRSAGRLAAAEELLREGLEKATPRPEMWDQLGLALLSQRRPEEAEAVAADGLARFPGSPRLELVRGLALAQKPGDDPVESRENRRAAIASLDSAIRGGQGGAGARVELAELLLEEDRVEDAILRLEEAVALSPSDPQTHYRLGLALRQVGRGDEAAEALGRFRALSEEQNAAETRAKRLGQRLNAAIESLQANQLTEALTAVEEVLAEAPDHARTLALKAKILFSNGDVAGAYDAAVAARIADPSMTEHHYLEGLFAYHLGNFKAADGALARALAIDPDLGEAHEVAAVMAYRSSRPAEAVAHFERAIELGVDHEELRRAYAMALEAAKAPNDP